MKKIFYVFLTLICLTSMVSCSKNIEETNKEKIENVINTIKTSQTLSIKNKNQGITILKDNDIYEIKNSVTKSDVFYYKDSFYLKNEDGTYYKTSINITLNNSFINSANTAFSDVSNMVITTVDKSPVGTNPNAEFLKETYILENKDYMLNIYNKNCSYFIGYKNISINFNPENIQDNNVVTKDQTNFSISTNISDSVNQNIVSNNFLEATGVINKKEQFLMTISNENYELTIIASSFSQGLLTMNNSETDETFSNSNYYTTTSSQEDNSIVLLKNLITLEETKITGSLNLETDFKEKNSGNKNYNSESNEIIFTGELSIEETTKINFVSPGFNFSYETNFKNEKIVNNYTRKMVAKNAFSESIFMPYSMYGTSTLSIEINRPDLFNCLEIITKKVVKSTTKTNGATYYYSADKQTYNSVTNCISTIGEQKNE